jgi:Ca-activated chloride channel family protein
MIARSILTLILVAVASIQAYAVGALFVRPLRSTQTYQAIAISKYDVKVKIQDHVATTYVDQVFRNELNQEVEATLIFPLPEGAVITELYYWFNGIRYKGSVREKKEAQAAYDAKIRRSMDPALLQEIGENIFKLQIAPIFGISDVRIEITYTEIMPFALGKSTYKHLLKTTGLSPKPLQQMSLTIDATTQSTWSKIESPSYINTPAHSIQMLSDKEARITLGDESFVPTKNYTLVLTAKRTGTEMGTLTYVPVPSDSFGSKPFFLTWVIPPDTGNVEVPRSVTFVADVSSSMTPRRMDQLRMAMTSFIEQLNPRDRFNILTFSTNVTSLNEDLIDATSENIEKARTFIQQMRALGLTNISEALRAAVQQSYNAETANAVVFLTDGQPSFGEQNETVILDSLKKWNRMNVTINPITIGEESSIALMKNVARQTGGYLTEIMNDDSIAIIIRDHLRRIAMPNLTNMTLEYGGLVTYDVEPQVLPNVGVGGRVIQTGLYEKGGTYPVTLLGMILGVNFRLTQDVVFGDPATSNKAVARLWARARVDALLEQIARYGEKKELVDAIIQLSIQFGILTKYTALYADPDDKNTSVNYSGDKPIEAIQIDVTPHPATLNSSLSVNISSAMSGQSITMQIIDMLGRVVADHTQSFVNLGVWTLPLSGFDLRPGTYIVVVRVGNSTTSQPIIVTEGAQ